MHYGQNYLKRRRSLRDTFDLVAPHAMRNVKNQIETLNYTSFTFRDVFTMKSWFALVTLIFGNQPSCALMFRVYAPWHSETMSCAGLAVKRGGNSQFLGEHLCHLFCT